jgi:hypothetical protein
MDNRKLSGDDDMKYTYEIKFFNDFFMIDETIYDKNNISYKLSWTNNQIFGQGSVLITDGLTGSVKRCKKWLKENHPELII